MILDEKLEFLDATSVAAAAGTAVVGDVVNLDDAGRDLLDTLYLVISVSTAFTSGGAATVDIRLTTAANAALDSGPVDIWTTGAQAYTALTAGTTYIVPLPKALAFKQYLGIRVVTATATTTAGSLNAFLTNDPQNWKAYADAQN